MVIVCGLGIGGRSGMYIQRLDEPSGKGSDHQ